MLLPLLSIVILSALPYQASAQVPELVIKAPSSPMTYDISGKPGERGSAGADGSTGSCQIVTDLNGNTSTDYEDGGDGERGGTGESGEDGGNLFVLYENLSDLKNILVNAKGGPGGDGGRGGSGGWGCSNGSDGPPGWNGDPGKTGSLYLISKPFHPYQPDNSNEMHKIAQLLEPLKIVKNIWSKSAGASSLLAPGSIIRDDFFNLEDYQYGEAKIELEDETMIDEKLLKEKVIVHMDKGETNIIFPVSLVASYKPNVPTSEAHILLSRLYDSQRFNSLSFKGIKGKNKELKIILGTSGPLIPMPSLKLNMKVELKGRFFKYRQIFSGPVNEEFISKTASGYEVKLSELALKENLHRGSKIRITLEHQLIEKDLESDKKIETQKLKI